MSALLNRTTPLLDPAPTRTDARPDHVARLRPTTAAAMFGGLLGLAIGCAYLGGTVAKATTVRAQAERLEGATAAGFTEEALAAAAGGLDASALTIARRHDPYIVAGSAQRDRQAELLTACLEQLRGGDARADLRRASLSTLSRDLECLTQAAYFEARGEGSDGMRAVVQVVLNRARHGAFPNSVCGVVFQGSNRRVGCQFSFTCDGSLRGRPNQAAWNRARDIASAALSGAVYAGVGNATHFHTTAVSPRWRNSLVRVNQVGSHVFYRFGGRAGSSTAFRYAVNSSTGAEVQRTVHAGIDPANSLRQAGQAIAYTALLAQEGRTEDDAPTTAPVAQAVAPAAAAPAPAVVPAPVAEAVDSASVDTPTA
ncbi:MAG: cell wall hydrolase [Brevundimonas sp. 12-68-7]|nr:MAG: cell wall hydrolase [Brevundimonas sp. 12-68-7]